MIQTLEELKKEIEKYSKPHDLLAGRQESPSLYQTRLMVLRQLQDKYRRRSGKVLYLDDFYLDIENYKPPNLLRKILHPLGLHHWLYYEDEHCYDTRICMICGISEWTIYPRAGIFLEHDDHYKLNPYEFPALEKLKIFVQAVIDVEKNRERWMRQNT